MLVRSEIAATKTDSEDIWIRGLRELFDFYLCNYRMVSVIAKDEAKKTQARKTHSNFTTIIGGLKFVANFERKKWTFGHYKLTKFLRRYVVWEEIKTIFCPKFLKNKL